MVCWRNGQRTNDQRMTTIEVMDSETVFIQTDTPRNQGWLLTAPFNEEVKKIIIALYVFHNAIPEKEYNLIKQHLKLKVK